MTPFTVHHGLVAPLDRANVDTDMILPKQFMKSVERTGYGDFLFDGLRYQDEGRLGMDCRTRPLRAGFVLNQPRYRGASILLARRNFGCGSSREHAVWALSQCGFRALVAPSYGDIFRDNCPKNGLLPVVLGEDLVDRLFREVAATPGLALTIDLPRQVVVMPWGEAGFDITPQDKAMLLQGLDEIALTLAHAEGIVAFERRHRALRPWLYPEEEADAEAAAG
jgi:3-isopropylmalate/(R)-2-methylmalate dehydratase small subunit